MGSGDNMAGSNAEQFQLLTASMIGKPVLGWRKGYGRTGHLHLGAWRPKPALRPTTVHRDEGEWVVFLLGCGRTLTFADGPPGLSSPTDDLALLELMPRLVGHRLESVDFDPISLELVLTFSDRWRLALWIDTTDSSDSDQWVLIHGSVEIVAFANRRWDVCERGKQ